MIKYSTEEFATWLTRQPEGPLAMAYVPLTALHTICLNFTDEKVREDARMARETAARRNTANAVAAEVTATQKCLHISRDMSGQCFDCGEQIGD